MPHNIFGNTTGKRILKAWSYILVPPAPTGLAVSLLDMKDWLKVTTASQDTLITDLIKSATLTGEKWTKRDFLNKDYKTFRNNFSDFPFQFGIRDEIVLRRSKLQSVISVEFLKETVLTAVDSTVFYITEETDFSRIIPFESKQWPIDSVDDREQAVVINFTAGFGITEADIPDDLQTAIKLHVAEAFANRGDCDNDRFLPARAQSIYLSNRITDIIGS